MNELTVISFDGKICRLSDELYVIKTNRHPSATYKKGVVVRKISSQPNEPVGSHFMRGWVTVCKPDVKIAEFCGIPEEDLKPWKPTLRQRRRTFLKDTCDHFNLTNRSTKEDPMGIARCKYFCNEDIGCAIGRHVKDKNLCKKWDELVYTTPIVTNIFEELPTDLQLLGGCFLRRVQQLHDYADNWTNTGLSHKGKESRNNIKIEFKL